MTGELTHRSLFGRAEYLVYPWLMASLKFDLFDAGIPKSARQAGFTIGNPDQTRIMPGAIILLRHNVKAVLEGELFTRHSLLDEAGRARPHSLLLRLDVAF